MRGVVLGFRFGYDRIVAFPERGHADTRDRPVFIGDFIRACIEARTRSQYQRTPKPFGQSNDILKIHCSFIFEFSEFPNRNSPGLEGHHRCVYQDVDTVRKRHVLERQNIALDHVDRTAIEKRGFFRVSGQDGYIMISENQFPNNARAEKSCSADNEYFHISDCRRSCAVLPAKDGDSQQGRSNAAFLIEITSIGPRGPISQRAQDKPFQVLRLGKGGENRMARRL